MFTKNSPSRSCFPFISPGYISNMKYGHPVLAKSLELHLELISDGKEIIFVWVPGHMAIRGNLAADSASKDAIGGDTSTV